MSELPSGLVTYNQPVCCVHWNNTEKRDNPVTVECDDGERIVADHVIVTVPLGKTGSILHVQFLFGLCYSYFNYKSQLVLYYFTN